MNDMSSTIVAKSDQINAADLVGISRTITVRDVKIKPGDDQPVSILIEGDNKAFRPCKGVRRLMVRVWGPDASKYVGQSMTLFQDPTVLWAGKPEGGIRVSHMTGLDKPITEPMRISRAATKPYEIKPLVNEAPANKRQTAEQWAADHMEAISQATDADALDALCNRAARAMAKLADSHPDTHRALMNAADARRAELSVEGKPAEDMGESFTGFEGEDA